MSALWIARIWGFAGKWLAIAGAVALAIVAALAYGWQHGENVEKARSAADRARTRIAAARNASEARSDADAAIESVRQQSASQRQPDVDARDDLNNRF